MERLFLPALGPHWGFIVLAYAVTALVLLLLAGGIIADVQGRIGELKELESRGIRRRSDRSASRTTARLAEAPKTETLVEGSRE